jgi:hypothetical protein
VGAEAFAIAALLAERHGLLCLAIQALADERVQCRQAVEQRRCILGVQGVFGHARVNEGPQLIRGAAKLVVLLGRLDKGSEVQPTKALKFLGFLGDAIELLQDFLEQLLPVRLAELWLLGGIASLRKQSLALVALGSLVLAIVFVVVLETNSQGL